MQSCKLAVELTELDFVDSLICQIKVPEDFESVENNVTKILSKIRRYATFKFHQCKS